MKNPNRFICFALALLVLSCNDDDLPNTSAENLIVMKAFYFRHNGPEKQTIVVTDPDGKVLSSLKSTYWVDTPIKPTLRGYHGDLVNIYLIDRYDSYYGISAFLNLKRGSEFVGPLYEYNYPGVEPSRLKLHNVEPFDHLTFSTDLVGTSITQLADTFSLLQNAHIEAGQAYGQLVSNGQGYYGFFDMDKESGMATLDRAGMNKPSSKFTIKLAPEVTYSNFSLVGSFDTASEGWGYQLFSTMGKSQLDIYYPEEPFAKYFSSLSYYANDRVHTIQREATSLDFNYEDITFNGVITSASPRNFRMDISGQFDYYVASYTSSSFYTYLTVYSSQRYVNFSIPDFSDIMGNEKFPFADLSWLHLEMLDHDGVQENDEDFKFFTSGKFRWPRDSRTVGMGMPLQ